jgi:hypothetical protein
MLSTRHADAFERELDLEEAGIACKKEEAEQVGDQRIIREIAIDGRPIDPVRMRRLPMSCGRIGPVKAARSIESINTPGINTHGEEEMPCSFQSFGLHTFLSSRSSCL